MIRNALRKWLGITEPQDTSLSKQDLRIVIAECLVEVMDGRTNIFLLAGVERQNGLTEYVSIKAEKAVKDGIALLNKDEEFLDEVVARIKRKQVL